MSLRAGGKLRELAMGVGGGGKRNTSNMERENGGLLKCHRKHILLKCNTLSTRF